MAVMAMREWNSGDVERVSLLGGMLVCGLLTLACVWLAVKMLWLLLPAGDDVDANVPIATVPAPSGKAAVSVSKWHLFRQRWPDHGGTRTQCAGDDLAAAIARHAGRGRSARRHGRDRRCGNR